MINDSGAHIVLVGRGCPRQEYWIDAQIENEKASGEVFNVGSGVPTSVYTVAKALVKHYGSNTEITVSGNYRIGDIRHNYADLSKIKSYLGYEPLIDFDSGIRKFVQWVNDQDIKEDRYQQSAEEMKQKGLLSSVQL